MATFDATPCLGASIDDLDVDYINNTYLPEVVDAEALQADKRDLKEKLASVRLYDRAHDCPTYAAMILFGRNPGDKTGDITGDKTGDMIVNNLSERQKAIYEMIAENQQISVNELSEKLEVSARTIKRDIAAMSKWVKHEGNTSSGKWVVTKFDN